MLHSQQQPFGPRSRTTRHRRNPLLQRHPVLVPLLLLVGAIILVITSFFADSLFPLLALIGTPSALICLLLAFVLGTCGILAGIIGIIERVEQSLQVAWLPKSKEHGYDRN